MEPRLATFLSELSDVETRIHSLGKDWLWFFGRYDLSDQEKTAWAGLAESLRFIRGCKALVTQKGEAPFKNTEDA